MTTSPPWASGARRSARPRRLGPALGRDSVAQIVANARRPRSRPAARCARRRLRRRDGGAARACGSRAKTPTKTSVKIVSTRHGDERDVRRADDRVDRGEREAEDRQRQHRPQPPAVARDGDAAATRRHEQAMIGRSRMATEPTVYAPSVGVASEPERDEHAAGDEHRREAGAQVAHLGVVERSDSRLSARSATP